MVEKYQVMNCGYGTFIRLYGKANIYHRINGMGIVRGNQMDVPLVVMSKNYLNFKTHWEQDTIISVMIA